MPDPFSDFLASSKKEVWPLYRSYLSGRVPIRHYQIVGDYPMRQGKYLRAGLLLLATEIWGGNKSKSLTLAAAVQASEDWLLIHDDVEDHSLFRRGRPSLSVLHGDELAINAGDSLQIIMWRIIQDSVLELGPKSGKRVFDLFNDVLLTTTEGQYLELSWRKQINLPSKKEYFDMAYKKAGCYSIFGPLALGAIVGGAKDVEIGIIKRWAMPLGIVFQIGDDLLNWNAPVLGKEQDEDLREGKYSLSVILALKSLPKTKQQKLRQILDVPAELKTKEEIKILKRAFFKKEYRLQAQLEAIRLMKIARKNFENHARKLPSKIHIDTLSSMMDFVESRAVAL